MATAPGVLDHARDLFAALGPLRTGRLFGGTAIYIEDAMFAVLFGDRIYMKCGSELTAEYLDHGSEPFSYGTKNGPRVINGLTSLPDDAMDDPELALMWAQKSLVIARDAAAKKRRK